MGILRVWLHKLTSLRLLVTQQTQNSPTKEEHSLFSKPLISPRGLKTLFKQPIFHHSNSTEKKSSEITLELNNSSEILLKIMEEQGSLRNELATQRKLIEDQSRELDKIYKNQKKILKLLQNRHSTVLFQNDT